MNPQPGVPVQPAQQQPGWFSRNWKWLVGLGCLLPIMCCGIFSVVTYFTVTKVIQNSGVYVEAVPRAIADPEVQAALGAPVAPGMMLQGSVKDENGQGSADLSIPLEGSKGKGTLRVNATKKSGGDWEYQVLEVEAGGKTINLLKGGALKGGDTQLPPDDAPSPDEEAPPEGENKPE